MGLILCYETSTTNCSVALARDGEVLAIRELNEGYTHAENITVFSYDVLKEAKLTINNLDAVAVSKGPGSYTGLRIGVSAAKGIAYSLNIPFIGISTLKSLALSGKQMNKSEELLYCPMIDARRLEVYCAVYDSSLTAVQPDHARILDAASFQEVLERNKILFLGDGSEKAKQLIIHPNALFAEGVYPSAITLAKLAEDAFRLQDFEDLALFEPYYLKDFIAGKGSVSPGQSS